VSAPRGGGAVRASAPARANLIGNPSDQYGGCTLACTVPLRARVVLLPAGTASLESGELRATLADPGDLAPRGDRLDLGRAVLRSLQGPLPPLRIRYESEIPLASGMAGSTALVVALLRALLHWRGERAPLHVVAERAREIERAQMGVTCGYVDQYMAAFGGYRFVDFRGKTPGGSWATEPFATAEPLEAPAPFVLGFTGVRHSSDSVHRPVQARWLEGDPAVVRGYRRCAELGRLGKRALLLEDWAELGALMNENHAIVRELGASGASNERLIAAALAAGAPGAKLAGAGDGGTIVALWPDPDASRLEGALRAAGAAALYGPRPVPGVSIEV
jgi:galactokinase/mevalonate kinase-like predicted kinase